MSETEGGTLVRRILMAALCALVLAPTTALAQARVLQPIDNWNWGKTDEYCGLVRNFGDADSPVRLVIYSYGPTGNYRVMVSGDNLPRNDEAAEEGSAAFGGVEDLQDIHMIVGKSGNGGSIDFQASRNTGFRFTWGWSGERDIASEIAFDNDATELTFDTPEMDPVTLMLGDIDEALDDLHTCEDQLVEGWNLGSADSPEIVQGPGVENGLEVLRAIRRPAAMLINRTSQIVQVRLVIDAQGELRDCVLQAPNWRDQDARGVCQAFSRLGRFAPARNADGEAVTGLLRGSYMLLIYD